MTGCLILQDRLKVPLVRTFEEFRLWALSDDFPESGRFDFIHGNIEIDLAPELAFTHNAPKVAILARLVELTDTAVPGYVFFSRMRFSSVAADLSVQPDVFFLSYEALDSGRATLTPDTGAQGDGCIEIEGAPDVIVEVVSDCSLKRDKHRLARSYFNAGVREFWLVDARGEELLFFIHYRGAGRFIAQPRDHKGFQHSEVFRRSLRLDRWRDNRGYWRYNLHDETQGSLEKVPS